VGPSSSPLSLSVEVAPTVVTYSTKLQCFGKYYPLIACRALQKSGPWEVTRCCSFPKNVTGISSNRQHCERAAGSAPPPPPPPQPLPLPLLPPPRCPITTKRAMCKARMHASALSFFHSQPTARLSPSCCVKPAFCSPPPSAALAPLPPPPTRFDNPFPHHHLPSHSARAQVAPQPPLHTPHLQCP
jgi:hypothetical protein